MPQYPTDIADAQLIFLRLITVHLGLSPLPTRSSTSRYLTPLPYPAMHWLSFCTVSYRLRNVADSAYCTAAAGFHWFLFEQKFKSLLNKISNKNLRKLYTIWLMSVTYLIQLTWKLNKTNTFLSINDEKENIITFSCEKNLRLLSTVDLFGYMDGIFDYCARIFCFLTIFFSSSIFELVFNVYHQINTPERISTFLRAKTWD